MNTKRFKVPFISIYTDEENGGRSLARGRSKGRGKFNYKAGKIEILNKRRPYQARMHVSICFRSHKFLYIYIDNKRCRWY